MPNPPTTWADSSESISPNKLVVTITSNSCGCRIKFIEHASTYISSNLISEKLSATFAHVLANNPSVFFMTLDL